MQKKKFKIRHTTGTFADLFHVEAFKYTGKSKGKIDELPTVVGVSTDELVKSIRRISHYSFVKTDFVL
ncbi:MAG: hypothetical protein ACLT76_03120 [Clostridium fessum]